MTLLIEQPIGAVLVERIGLDLHFAPPLTPTDGPPGLLAGAVAAQFRHAHRRDFVADHVAEFGEFTEQESERAREQARRIVADDDEAYCARTAAVVVDHEAFAALVRDDREFVALFDVLDRDGVDFFVSSATIVEGTEPQEHAARVSQVLRGMHVEPVTERSARRCTRILRDAGVHGGAHVVDAAVAELALRFDDGTAAILTSDVDAMRDLVAGRVRIASV